jgi:triosephosphate isomerase (TIM)
MITRPVLAANWKMNLGPDDARAFIVGFVAHAPEQFGATVILCPPDVSLDAARAALSGRRDIRLGAQNIYWEDKGAFTGEISAPLARAAGAAFVLVGHSERRHVFGETDEETGRKCDAAVRAGLTPILCVGESLVQREAGETERVVLRQLHAGFRGLTPDQVAGSLVAYEPVWAIGTGRTATPVDASTTHRALRAAVGVLLGGADREVPILYGGSVTPANAAALLAAPGVDGLLVGGASLDPVSWATIVAAGAAASATSAASPTPSPAPSPAASPAASRGMRL